MDAEPSSSYQTFSLSCQSSATSTLASASSSASGSYSSSSRSSLPPPALAFGDDRPITNLDRRLYLAIDCGGTKAAAVISDQDGDVVSRGFGGPANFTDVGLDVFLLSVQDAIRQALANCPKAVQTQPPAGLPPGVAGRAEALFEAAWFGIAGVDSDVDVQQLTPYLASLLSLPYPSNRLLVANDTSLLAAPVRDPAYPDVRSGVVVIAGTGSIVMSFKSDDDGMLQTLGRVGGFGWLLGDEGSGFWVGRDALRFILDQADRDRLGGTSMFGEQISASAAGKKPETFKDHDHLLRDRILELWNLSSTDEIFNAVYSNRPPGQPRTPALRSGEVSPPSEPEYDEESDEDAAGSSSGSDVVRPSGRTSLHGDSGLSGINEAADIDASPSRDSGLASRLMPPSAPSVALGGSRSPIPPMSPYASVSSLAAPLSASASTDTLDETLADLMVSSMPALGGRRQKRPGSGRRTKSSSMSASQQLEREEEEMRLHYNEPGHERAESVTSARSAADAAEAAATAPPAPATAAGAMLQERKHRLASLAPLVFHLALQHNDVNSLAILRGQARRLARQIASVFPADPVSSAYIEPARSVLCMGGSLLGVEAYRGMVEEELRDLGVDFARCVVVADPAKSGAVALAKIWEERTAVAAKAGAGAVAP